MKSILQNVKTGEVSVADIPQPLLADGNVLVRNVCSLVSAGTEKAVLDFSSANYLKKARMRPDLFRKVLNRAKNEGLWQTYKVVSELIDQEIQLGYSCAGIVEQVGREVQDLQVGQRVACAGLFAATHSEVVSVPRNLIAPIPDGVSFDEACFVTLGAIAMQGVRLADLSLSEHVVVYGLGLVGMVSAQLALAAGCHVIGLDIDPAKIRAAEDLGVKGVIIDSSLESNIRALTGGFGADKVLLCAATKSNEPIERIPEITRQKGILVVVGDVSMNVPRRTYFEKEIDIRVSRSYGPGRYDLSYEHGGTDYPYAYVRWTENRNMVSVLDLIGRGRLDFDKLISHRFSIEQAQKAYELIEGKTGEKYLGIVIRYCDDEPRSAVERSVSRAPAAKPAGDLRLGIIGAGNFAKAFLLPAFHRQPGVRFHGISTASGVSAANMARKYDMKLATSDVEELLASDEVDALVIASRHDSHARYVTRGLELGKSVYVEKPLATTMDDLERIRELYQSEGPEGRRPLLMVGYNRRFSPLTATLKSAFAASNEPISVIYRVNAGFIPPTEWVHDPVQGGGRIIGEACHFIDFVSALVGEPAVTVSASVLGAETNPVPDVVTISIEFPNGSLGTIHYFANGHSSMPKEYVEVFGGGVSASMTNFRQLKVHGANPSGKKKYLNQVKGYEEEAAEFVASIKRGGPAPIPFDQLYATTKATLLVGQAIAGGQKIRI